ncbi:MAG: thermonuclease family protein [Candidatus Taylorbacteria bacterium]|nr:thermonuclease family protein [Candidatus Taylorbacteria bacterium]
MSEILSFLKKYKVKSLIIALIILSTSGATYVSSTSKSPTKKKNIPKIEVNKPYEVIKVIDGDTFEIKVDTKIVKVRMLGVDTPETVDPRKVVQCFGKIASDKTKELLLKHSVTLETDPTQGIVDKYGRVLAYVYRDDGLFINKYLLENGYAHEYTYNIPYQKQLEFKELAKVAQTNKLGLWDSCNSI